MNTNVFAQLKDSLPPLVPVQDPTLPNSVFAPISSDTPAQLAPVGKKPALSKVFAPTEAATPKAASSTTVFAAPDDTETAIHNRLNQRVVADYRKDADPYGSADNHPGFFGKLLHGLSVATGGVNRRAWEEQALENRAENLAKDQSEQNLQSAEAGNQQATAAHTNAETPEIAPNAESTRTVQGATARHLNDESNALENPQPKFTVHDTDAGPLLVDDKGNAQHLTVDGQPVGPKLKLTQSQPIIGADGKPHTYMLDEKGNKVVDLGEHYERPININAGNKEAIAQRQTIFKTYQPVMDSAERMNVMTKNYEDAIKNHNQQAMLSLLYNHMGMTMGLQKGARMTQDLIREAQQSQPWLQGIKAKFDSNGYLTGVTLSPQQMRDMVALAQDRYKEDVGKARNEAGYLGATDDGPARTPGTATINYYMNLAGGDMQKAKRLAADDGWSVK